MKGKLMLLSLAFVFLWSCFVSAAECVEGEVPDVSWQVTISATNQLEPVIVGMIPDAQDGKDEYDEFTQPPVMGKVILSLDTVYATSIKKTRECYEILEWNLNVGVPEGQSTTLSWDVPDGVNLVILEGDEVLEPGASLNVGNNELTVRAEVVEDIIPDVSWEVEFSATNQLELVSVGMNPMASDDIDGFDDFTQPPELEKVIMTLDDLYAKSIKRTRPYGEEINWNLRVWVPEGQSTTLSWDVPFDVDMMVYRVCGWGCRRAISGKGRHTIRLGEGRHYISIRAGVLETASLNLTLNKGWNMVSVPFIPKNESVEAVFDCVSTLGERPVMTWEAPGFVKVDRVEPKKGYWVFSPEDSVCELVGTVLRQGERNYFLDRGWNMIGSCGMDESILSGISNQVVVRPPVTWNDPLFSPVGIIGPGEAAWVFVLEDTEATCDDLIRRKGKMQAVLEGENPIEEIEDGWSVTITATNQLEPVMFGISNGEEEYWTFTQPPVLGKVIMSLDQLYATRINRDRSTWQLDVGIPEGESVELTWDLDKVPDDVSLKLGEIDMKEQDNIRLSGRSHSFVIEAKVEETESAKFVRGDANDDGSIDVGDAVFILNYLFSRGEKPTCLDAADVNDDGKIDISDAVKLLGYIFAGGNAPSAPFLEPGVDPSEDGLGCGT